MQILRVFSVLLLLFLLSCDRPVSVAERGPNIVLILADDLGWRQLGCYGSDFYWTPNIDQLANQGIRFTDAYAAAPVCSPTRASLMTGKYPARLHLTDFIKGTNQPPESPLKLPEWTPYLKLEETTIAEALKNQGYATACFGKWHLSKAKQPPASDSHNPDKQGFDQYFVTYKPEEGLARPWQTAEDDGHNVRLITEKSLQFIEENRENPFFLYISHNTIHRPLMEKAKLIGKYQEKAKSDKAENNPVIAAMIETLDRSVGQVIAKLTALDLTDNTMVVFFSDNGGLATLSDQTPLRSGKGSLYEGGIRVPLIFKWPGHIKAGTIDATPVCSIDFFPTLLAVAGRKETGRDLDGENILPLLTGKGDIRREALFFHYPHFHKAGEGPSGAVRQGDFKLIEWYEKSYKGIDQPGALELFNLRNDIGEQHNLAAEDMQLTRELYERLNRWRKEIGAQDMVRK